MHRLAFHQRHIYSDQSVGIEIPVRLDIGNQTVRLIAKIDTGASFCIFAREYAEPLGIEVEQGTRQVLSTVTGNFTVYGHAAKLSCLGVEIDAIIYFAEMPNFARNVLGRTGWLHQLRLGIVDHDSAIFLSHYDDE